MTIKFTYNDGGRKSAGYKGDAGDCVVRAIAIATEFPYRQVYKDLQGEIAEAIVYGRKSKLRSSLVHEAAMGRVSPRNGVHKKLFHAYLIGLGWQWIPTMSIGSGCTVHLRAEELPAGRIVASVSKHLVAVIDGAINDTYDPSRDGTRCVYGYYGLAGEQQREED